jgi:hypothetical protein
MDLYKSMEVGGVSRILNPHMKQHIVPDYISDINEWVRLIKNGIKAKKFPK